MFVIVNREHWDLIDFDFCNETSTMDCKMSVDCTKIMISYEGEQPDFCFDISNDDIGLVEYTDKDILELIKDVEWSPLS